MLRFNCMGFPVTVHWWFWLLTAFLGGALDAKGPQAFSLVLIFMGIAFLSILAHELGHALAARQSGSESQIELHGMGGLARFSPMGMSRNHLIRISLAGPGAGFALAAIFWAINVFVEEHGGFYGRHALGVGMLVNTVWSIFNLIPIYPMDGGQVLNLLLGPERRGTTAGIGAGLAILIGVYAFRMGQPYLAILMGFFAFSNLASAGRQQRTGPN